MIFRLVSRSEKRSDGGDSSISQLLYIHIQHVGSIVSNCERLDKLLDDLVLPRFVQLTNRLYIAPFESCATVGLESPVVTPNCLWFT
jgi:hypothetical protein